MPRKKEVLEDQETEMLTLAAPEEAAESPDFPAESPFALEDIVAPDDHQLLVQRHPQDLIHGHQLAAAKFPSPAAGPSR